MGVPVIGCSCAVCRSKNPKNKRLRPGALIQANEKVFLIDPGPDFRTQALKEGIHTLDGVLITHAHHDHTAGIDDLRVYNKGDYHLPCLLSQETYDDLKVRYAYIFNPTAESKTLLTRFSVQLLENTRGSVDFEGLPIRYFTFEQMGMAVNGYRLGNFAYVSDIKHYPETLFEDLEGVEILVVSALRKSASHMHFNLSEAVAFAQKVRAKETYLTHIAHDLEHEATNKELPLGIFLAYDELEIEFCLT